MNQIIKNIIDQQFQKQKRFNKFEINDLSRGDFLISIKDGQFHIQGSFEMDHGQEVRLNLILPYVATFIQEYNEPSFDFIICLEDTLKTNYEIDIPVLCLSKIKEVNGLILPNIDFFTKYMEKALPISRNDLNYDEKLDKSIFIGSSTGNFEQNKRMLFCQKCLNNDTHKAYISNLCQNDREIWLDKYPFAEKVLHITLSIKDQLKYKLLVNIDGNTSCWSRLYWQMNSNSLPVYINEQQTDIQFFDFVDNSNCYISCNLENSIETLDSLLLSPKEQIEEIINNGKKYCDVLFKEYSENPQPFLQEIINLLFLKYMYEKH